MISSLLLLTTFEEVFQLCNFTITNYCCWKNVLKLPTIYIFLFFNKTFSSWNHCLKTASTGSYITASARYLFFVCFSSTVNNILVLDLPWLFKATWKIVKAWLPAKGIEKIHFVDRKTMDQFISKVITTQILRQLMWN